MARVPQLEPAFRVEGSGKVYKTGYIHDVNKLPAKVRARYDDYALEPGFVHQGRFFTRDEVAKVFGSRDSVDLAYLKSYGGSRYGTLSRKSSPGGEVQVSAYEREGRSVNAYTRSKPRG